MYHIAKVSIQLIYHNMIQSPILNIHKCNIYKNHIYEWKHTHSSMQNSCKFFFTWIIYEILAY